MVIGFCGTLIVELDDGKIYRKALYLMVKTMVSCRFSLKPIQLIKGIDGLVFLDMGCEITLRCVMISMAGESLNIELNDGFSMLHGSLNVPIEHHPTIRYMVYNGYYKVMSNIPKMGQLPTPAIFDYQKGHV